MILVFKTSVADITDVERLKLQLDDYLNGAKWNFDLEDCDRILRIDSTGEVTGTVIRLLEGNGFCCEELMC